MSPSEEKNSMSSLHHASDVAAAAEFAKVSAAVAKFVQSPVTATPSVPSSASTPLSSPLSAPVVSSASEPQPVSPVAAMAASAAAAPLGQTADTKAEKEEGKEPSKAKPAYLPAPQSPTQSCGHGIRYDFNMGARIQLPNRSEGKWRIVLRDLDTGNILFFNENTGAMVASSKRYYVRFGIEITDVQADGTEKIIFTHELDCRNKEVVIQLPVGTLGDTLAWFPYVVRFAEERGARVTCLLSGLIKPALMNDYPNIRLLTSEEAEKEKVCEKAYATYCLGLFFDDAENVQQPTDFRFVGLHRTAGYILGVSPKEEPPRLLLSKEGRPIKEKYVCIAVQASTQCKYWNNPGGWREVVTFLKEKGYRVICIDQKPIHGTGVVWNHIPYGSEDQTGDRPLTERIRWLQHAEAFIGVSSGLAWLAWGAGTKVVMISGFTHPTNEFETPYRVINWHTCNSCWNDPRVRFDHHNFMWCPRHENTPRQFECSRLITGKQVIDTLEKVIEE